MKTSVKLLLRTWIVFQLTYGYDIKRIDRDQMWMDGVNFYKEIEHGSAYQIEQTGYGTEWVLFPDGHGISHFVNLNMTASRPSRSGQNIEIEYRLYIRGLFDYISLNQSAQAPNGTDVGKLLSNKTIKLVTHGWISSVEDGMVMGIKNAYLKNNDVAVIAVDWRDAAKDFFYVFAVENTGAVGARVGQFLDAFCERYNISGNRLHLIGHSLGAHLMGVAASTANVSIGRVTGLDPARPLYEVPKKPSSLTLDSSDAEFVDIIHSCSGALGVGSDNGHADFYPNSGISPQPGCDRTFLFIVPESCSHGRAHMYFTESIDNPTGFLACRAENWTNYLNNTKCIQQTLMGENVDRNASGRYYLKTNEKEPYATNVSREQ